MTAFMLFSVLLLGAFIFISGTSHQWYEKTVVHRGWNQAVQFATGKDSKIAEIMEHEEEHEHDEAPVAADDHADSEDFIPALWSWITFLGEARRLL